MVIRINVCWNKILGGFSKNELEGQWKYITESTADLKWKDVLRTAGIVWEYRDLWKTWKAKFIKTYVLCYYEKFKPRTRWRSEKLRKVDITVKDIFYFSSICPVIFFFCHLFHIFLQILGEILGFLLSDSFTRGLIKTWVMALNPPDFVGPQFWYAFFLKAYSLNLFWPWTDCDNYSALLVYYKVKDKIYENMYLYAHICIW